MLEIKENFLTYNECSVLSAVDVISHGKRIWDVEEQNSEVKVKRSNIKPFVNEMIDKHNIPYSCAVELLKYLPGSMSSPHQDIEGSHYDSSGVHRITSWSKTGIVLLNDDFEGGDLYFPNLGISFGKEVKSSLITFPAGDYNLYVHGVTPVTSGIRYTLIFRYEKE